MSFLHNTKLILSDAISAVVPSTCEICGASLTSSEHWLCLDCLLALPRTNVHRRATNRVSERLLRYFPDCRLASWYYYRRQGQYAALIHSIKYADRPKMGTYFGRMYATELAVDRFFDGIDIILPVPIHWTKFLWRGYNQSLCIARGVADVCGLPIGNQLYARHTHATQTRRSQTERMANVQHDLFGVRRASSLSGKRVLLIDDVVTTGSTVEACVSALKRAVPTLAGIDILTLGMTEND
jgi:ComF family protein